MTLGIEVVVDRLVGGNETLSLTLGLEELHFSLPSSYGEVRIFSAIVIAQPTGLVKSEAAQFAQRSFVGSQSIGDDGFGNEALVLEQFSQQFQRCLLVPSLLDERLFDVSQAQSETKIEPHGLANNVGRKAITIEGNGLHASLFMQQSAEGGDRLALD